MKLAAVDAQELARAALELMDAGDYAGTHELLSSVAKKDDLAAIERRLVRYSPQSADDLAIEHAVAECVFGPGSFRVLPWLATVSGTSLGHGPNLPSVLFAGGDELASNKRVDQLARDKFVEVHVAHPRGLAETFGIDVEGMFSVTTLSAASNSYATSLRILKHELVTNTQQLQSASDLLSRIGTLAHDFAAKVRPGRKGTSTPETAGLEVSVRWLIASQRAHLSVGERTMRRLVWIARESGMSQREIAGLAEMPQTQVFRQLRAIDDDPSLLALSPRELVDNYRANRFDRLTLLKLLAAYPYTAGEFPDEEPDWGYLPGSWDQLTQLAMEGAISREELEVVIAGSKARTSHVK